MNQTGVDQVGLDWAELNGTGSSIDALDSTGLDWIKTDWTKLDWTELDLTEWTGLGQVRLD